MRHIRRARPGGDDPVARHAGVVTFAHHGANRSSGTWRASGSPIAVGCDPSYRDPPPDPRAEVRRHALGAAVLASITKRTRKLMPPRLLSSSTSEALPPVPNASGTVVHCASPASERSAHSKLHTTQRVISGERRADVLAAVREIRVSEYRCQPFRHHLRRHIPRAAAGLR
jgi:hypothetical protein